MAKVAVVPEGDVVPRERLAVSPLVVIAPESVVEAIIGVMFSGVNVGVWWMNAPFGGGGQMPRSSSGSLAAEA